MSLSGLGQGVGVNDPEQGLGLIVHLAFRPVQARLGETLAVFGAVEPKALHGHRAHHEPVVPCDAGLGGECVELEVIPLGESLLTCVIALPAQEVDAAAGGGEHLSADLLGAETAPAQRGDIVAQVGDQGATAVLSAVAFVHFGEHAHHVAHGGDLSHADGVAGASGGGAVGDLLDVREWQRSSGHRIGGGRQKAAPVQLEPPHRQQSVQRIHPECQPDGVTVPLAAGCQPEIGGGKEAAEAPGQGRGEAAAGVVSGCDPGDPVLDGGFVGP